MRNRRIPVGEPRPLRLSLALAAWLILAHGVAVAQVPALLNYQGRITTGSFGFDGTGQFKMALVNADGSQTYWRNAPDGNSDGQPDAAVPIPVSRGRYALQLGDSSLANMAALPPTVFEHENVYLRVWFDDGIRGFQHLTPDQRVTAVGYALMAAAVPDGTITAAKLAPNALSAANLTGTLDPARLPLNVAFKDPDLINASNSLAQRLEATNAVLMAEVAALLAQAQSLSNQIAGLTNGLASPLPSGMTVVSSDAADPVLNANGYAYFTSLSSPAWETGTLAAVPAARHAHTAVWTGQEMLIWGGCLAPDLYSKTGGRYAPLADAWVPLSTFDAPAARQSHSAVWTGTEMIVWGGFGTGGYLDTGGRYRPDSQAWFGVATKHAPAGRSGHACVWTGDRMIVWGGRSFAGYLADGGLYHPATDQWTGLTLPGAPAPRQRASAIWTGTQLLVWGGEGDGGPLASGGRLSVDSGGNATTWQSVSAANAPGARVGHSAVWTSQRMIVWGGRNAVAFLGDGALYDPDADVWTALPTNGAPTARANHSVFWTGHEMLVVGGEGASGALASAAAYDPAADRWRTIDAAGDSVARTEAAGVWTGTRLILFGGKADGQPIGAVRRLNPQPAWHLYRKL